MRILLTGFEPNDDGLNASELVITSLRDNPPQELSNYINCIDFKVMPGDTNILGPVVDETLEAYSPDICILTGQARGYNKITLERMAKNLKYFVTLDRAGNAPKSLFNSLFLFLHHQKQLIPLLNGSMVSKVMGLTRGRRFSTNPPEQLR